MNEHIHLSATFKKMFSVGLIVSLFAASLCFGVNVYDDITIATLSSPSTQSHHGYAEWSFLVTNTSTKDPHKVELVLPDRPYSYGDSISSIKRTVTVAPMSSAKMSIYQPAVRMDGTNITVYVDGRIQKEVISSGFGTHANNRHHYGGSGTPVCILMSKNVSYDDFSKGTAPAKSSRHSSSPQTDLDRSEISLSQWSTDWLGYSRYDGIVLTPRDMEQMPVTVANAIYDYVQCGGTLLVQGDFAGSARFKTEQEKVGPFTAYRNGFGLFIIDDSDASVWGKKKWNALCNSIWGKTALPFAGNSSIKNINDKFQVISALKIPAKGLLFLVIFFAVAIGPANLYILSRMKRRIWLLWTVPVLSVIASISVFVYATFAEGWAGVRRSETLTILSEADNTATTIGVCAFYSPLTPKGGLLFDYATEVTALGLQQWHGGRRRSLELTNGQEFSRGWVAARVPAHFLVRKSETRRERVKITTSDTGDVFAVNGLGEDITELWYMDDAGKVYKAQHITAGAKSDLISTSLPEKLKHIQPRDIYSNNNWPSRIQSNTPTVFLKPNTYVAQLDSSLFLEQALANVKEDNSRSIVIGVLKGNIDAGSGN